MVIRLSLFLFLFSNSLFAKNQLSTEHHINLGKRHLNKQLTHIGHIHLAGGIASLAASDMEISREMQKDFQMLNVVTTALGGGHYISTIDKYEKRLEEELSKKRASTVIKFLRAEGLSPKLFISKEFGEDASTSEEEDAIEDRRVDLTIIYKYVKTKSIKLD